jgi:hypothetical protein
LEIFLLLELNGDGFVGHVEVTLIFSLFMITLKGFFLPDLCLVCRTWGL